MRWQIYCEDAPKAAHEVFCIKGTRAMRIVLDNLAAGVSPSALLARYPELCLVDIRASLECAEEIVHDWVVMAAVSTMH